MNTHPKIGKCPSGTLSTIHKKAPTAKSKKTDGQQPRIEESRNDALGNGEIHRVHGMTSRRGSSLEG